MKILLSACAADPSHGSEGYFGWSAFEALQKNHEVKVITAQGNRPSIVRELGSEKTAQLFRFAGPPPLIIQNRMLARMQSWRHNLAFHRAVGSAAEKWMRDEKFDLVHHITYSTWRVATPLWKLPIPLVWGPLGGGEIMPRNTRSILSHQARVFEFCRDLSDFISGHSRHVRACAKGAAIVISSNHETCLRLIQIGVPKERIRIFSPAHFSKKKIESYVESKDIRDPAGPLRLFAGGNLEGRKGIAIALQALAIAKDQGLKFTYTLGGGGPEASYLKKLAHKLRLEREVIFHPGFRGQDYLNELKQSHVYLLPSLRENAGITLLEAMLAGCVPVVADAGGPGEIVTTKCGFKCPLGPPEDMAIWICERLMQLWGAREKLESLGVAARQRVVTDYSTDHWMERVESAYTDALGNNGREASLNI
jgi:glycosyltransferase involved in cell wall biosynthesis